MASCVLLFFFTMGAVIAIRRRRRLRCFPVYGQATILVCFGRPFFMSIGGVPDGGGGRIIYCYACRWLSFVLRWRYRYKVRGAGLFFQLYVGEGMPFIRSSYLSVHFPRPQRRYPFLDYFPRFPCMILPSSFCFAGVYLSFSCGLLRYRYIGCRAGLVFVQWGVGSWFCLGAVYCFQ